MIFDLTSEKSFLEAKRIFWALKSINKNVVVMLIGNKEDLVYLKKVQKKDIQEFVKDYKLEYIEVSSLSSFNVDKAFYFLMNPLTKKLEENLHDREINKFFDSDNDI